MAVEIRDARVSDIPHLAYSCMQATGGVYEALYEDAIPGRDTHLIIEHLYSRLDSTSSFRNCRILESDGEAAGSLHGYPVDAEAHDPEDPLVRLDRLHLVTPFEELHPPAGSYYVHSVALYPKHRGRGYGRRLMQEAESIARSSELEKVSLHVFEENRAAVNLYESLGYEVVGRRPVIPHPLIRYEGELLLMAKIQC